MPAGSEVNKKPTAEAGSGFIKIGKRLEPGCGAA